MSSRIELHPAITEIGEELKEFIPEEISKYNTFYAGSGGIYGTVKGGKLLREAFPHVSEILLKEFPLADVMMLLYYY